MPTDIEWTRGDDGSKGETWNPVVGCERCSPGCDHCYAIRVAAREMQPAHKGLTERVIGPDGDPIDWTGEVRLLPERLDEPLHWRKPRRCFVCSMSDLFHPDVPYRFIREVFNTMRVCNGTVRAADNYRYPSHTFQVLTKRPQRMAALANDRSLGFNPESPPPNVWLGTSVENQRYADMRIPHLLATPAAIRFLSIEPLLEPVDLSGHLHPRRHLTDGRWHDNCRACQRRRVHGGTGSVDWVIVGGESGPGARPMHPDWVRSIRDQCVAAGVPFFLKQWGEFVRADQAPDDYSGAREVDGLWKIGKARAGRQLDGRTWDEMPSA